MSPVVRRPPNPFAELRVKPRAERETLEVTLPDGRAASVLRVRDPRARRIKLLVSDNGARLTVPLRASLREADRFLDAHLHWLSDQLERRASTPEAPSFGFGQMQPLPLRGEALPVRWSEGRALHIQCDGEGLLVTHPAHAKEESLRRAVRDFYLAQARHDVGHWLPKYVADLPRVPSAVRIRPLRSLWGSLSSSGAMSLDLALVLGPPRHFEYVLVHELCHLIHANHSRWFWREVERRWPAWRDSRSWFRAEGLALKSELRRLAS